MDVPFTPNKFTEIPCDLLLILARKLDPEDYLGLSVASKGIRNCLKTGRYTEEEEEVATNFIEEQKEKLRKMLEEISFYPLRGIKKYPNAPEKLKLIAVKHNPEAIQFIENPSEAVQIAAVSKKGGVLKYIKNPSKAVKLAAVKQDGSH